MSLWDRLRGALGGHTPEPAAPRPVEPAPRSPASPGPVAPPTALDELADLATGLLPADAETKAIEWLDRAANEGLEVDALDHARRLLARVPYATLALRVAERLDARGDELGAETVLAPILAGGKAPLDAWMLAGEIAERRGDAVAALAHYERVVARDFSYPRARERAARLSEKLRGGEGVDAGATLMGAVGGPRRFRILRELGRGGAGTVFLADDVPLERQVALKIYQRRGRSDRQRMLHEARVPSLLARHDVVRVLDVDETVMGIAMELVPAGSLRAEITRGVLTAERIARITTHVARVLAYAHARGWVHRDVKPSNVLLRPDDRIVLTDFGISGRVGTAGVPNEGTPGYMPKEQRAGAAAHPSMDVHALGVTMLEMLAPHGEALEALTSLARAATRAEPSARPPIERFVNLG